MDEEDDLPPATDTIRLIVGGHTAVYRQGQTVIRETGPWAPAVHALLRHLESVGFTAAPRIVGTGFDALGRETLSYIEGVFMQPGPWSLEGAAAVGALLRDLHAATASFEPRPDAIWQRWSVRSLGGRERLVGHCDLGPWNIVARDGLPVGLIDWEYAGPVDPLVELAQTGWLNARLHDDIVAEREGLPPLAERARQLRAIVDAYGLPARRRRGFVELMVQVAIEDAVQMADDYGILPESTNPAPLWGLAWRTRGAAWMLRHRRTLQNALA